MNASAEGNTGKGMMGECNMEHKGRRREQPKKKKKKEKKKCHNMHKIKAFHMHHKQKSKKYLIVQTHMN